jgi:hypothetical protein
MSKYKKHFIDHVVLNDDKYGDYQLTKCGIKLPLIKTKIKFKYLVHSDRQHDHIPNIGHKQIYDNNICKNCIKNSLRPENISGIKTNI